MICKTCKTEFHNDKSELFKNNKYAQGRIDCSECYNDFVFNVSFSRLAEKAYTKAEGKQNFILKIIKFLRGNK